jgi:hypothetical protein
MNAPENITTERTETGNRKYETIKQLAKRHMMDQSHTTTDEELKNAMVELDNQILVEYNATGARSKKEWIR